MVRYSFWQKHTHSCGWSRGIWLKTNKHGTTKPEPSLHGKPAKAHSLSLFQFPQNIHSQSTQRSACSEKCHCLLKMPHKAERGRRGCLTIKANLEESLKEEEESKNWGRGHCEKTLDVFRLVLILNISCWILPGTNVFSIFHHNLSLERKKLSHLQGVLWGMKGKRE